MASPRTVWPDESSGIRAGGDTSAEAKRATQKPADAATITDNRKRVKVVEARRARLSDISTFNHVTAAGAVTVPNFNSKRNPGQAG